jgi:hypothetical protein
MRLLFFLLVLASSAARAQTYYAGKEYGVAGGASQYFGDLNDHYGVDYVRPYVGAFVRFHVTPYIGIRTSLGYTHVGYDDKFNQNEYQRLRNLNFRSDVVEGLLQAEFNFFRFSTGEVGSRFTPYLTGGVGAFYFDPFTIYNGRRAGLRAIGTEGQNAGFAERRYSNYAVCFPVGAGFKSWIRPGMNFGIEIADRLTLTDYLDDVSTTYVGAEKFPAGSPNAPNPAAILQDRSVEIQPNAPIGREGKQRGNSQTKDQYMVIQVNLSFQLKSYRCPNYLKEGGLY